MKHGKFAGKIKSINWFLLLSMFTGTKQHERTSHSCIDSAFKFINDNYATWTKDKSNAKCDHFLPLPDDLSEYSPAKQWEKERHQHDSQESIVSEVSRTSNKRLIHENTDLDSECTQTTEGHLTGTSEASADAAENIDKNQSVKEDENSADILKDVYKMTVNNSPEFSGDKDETDSLYKISMSRKREVQNEEEQIKEEKEKEPSVKSEL